MATKAFKEQKIAHIKDYAQKAKVAIVTNYKGLTVLEDTEFRNAFRKANCKYKVLKNTMVRKAFNELGVDIKPTPIRGGTDGAQLSFKGLPCPNLPTGGENYHSVKEFVSVDAMRLMIKAVVKIVTMEK